MSVPAQDDLETELYNTLQHEIFVELLKEDNIQMSEEETRGIMIRCKHNPWDAIIVSNISQLVKQKST